MAGDDEDADCTDGPVSSVRRGGAASSDVSDVECTAAPGFVMECVVVLVSV